MTKEEAEAKLGTILGSLLSYIVTHIKEFTLVYAVIGGVFYGAWEYVFRHQLEAWAGDQGVAAVTKALTADCVNNPTMPGYNPHSLACQKEEEIAAEKAQTKAIEDLNVRFDAYLAQQAETEIKRTQETEQIIRLLQGIQGQ